MFGAASITGQVVAASYKWQQMAAIVLLIIIEVNIFIGIFNLLPLLPLDGGHICDRPVRAGQGRGGQAAPPARSRPGRHPG